jgi:hypothetical protein
LNHQLSSSPPVGSADITAILLQAEMERSKCILVKKAKKKMGTRKMRVKSNLKYYKWHVTSSRRLPPLRYVSSLRDKS